MMREDYVNLQEGAKERSMTAGEWQSITLADAPIEIIDGDRGKNYPKQSSFLEKGHCLFLNAGNFTLDGFNFSTCAFISPYSDQLLGKGKLVRHDVVLTTRGTVGNAAHYDETVPYEQIRINSGMVILRAASDFLDSRFLYFVTRSQLFRSQVKAFSTGSAQPQLPIRDIVKINIPIPPLPEQRAIAHVLGTLDDKIELNRRMNETLESMARALFKSWFVDFDPVRAKMDGRWRPGESLPGLPAHLYDLFPDHLVDSELGPIPEGWEVRRLGDCLTTLESGNRPKGGVSGIAEGIPSVGAESIERVGAFDFSKTKYVSRKFYASMKRGVVQDGDVLIYKDGGRPGELLPAVTYASHNFPFDEFCINEHVFRVRASRFSQQLLYCYLTTQEAFWQMRELATGAAQPGLNRGAVESIPVKMPSDTRLLKACEEQIGSLLDRCNVNALKSHALSQTRDTLLPRLVSGEMKVDGSRLD